MTANQTPRDALFDELLQKVVQAVAPLRQYSGPGRGEFTTPTDSLWARRRAAEEAVVQALEGLPFTTIVDDQPFTPSALNEERYCFVNGLVDPPGVDTRLQLGSHATGAVTVSLLSDGGATHSVVLDPFHPVGFHLKYRGGAVTSIISEAVKNQAVRLTDGQVFVASKAAPPPVIALALGLGGNFHRFPLDPVLLFMQAWLGDASMCVLPPGNDTPAVVAAIKTFNKATGMVTLRPDASGQRFEEWDAPFIYQTTPREHWTVVAPRAVTDQLLPLNAGS